MRSIIAVLLLCACPTTSTPCPGDEQLGTYTFRTENAPNCDGGALSELPDASFEFSARFCRFRDGGDAFVSIGGVAHVAVWDEQTQTITATYSARRSFSECSCYGPNSELGTLMMEETISATLLSRSQLDIEGGCTTTPKVDPDAGINRPGSESGKFDAVKACGTLGEALSVTPKPTAETEADSSCKFACDTCRLSYTISADRGDIR